MVTTHVKSIVYISARISSLYSIYLYQEYIILSENINLRYRLWWACNILWHPSNIMVISINRWVANWSNVVGTVKKIVY